MYSYGLAIVIGGEAWIGAASDGPEGPGRQHPVDPRTRPPGEWVMIAPRAPCRK